MTGKAAGKSCYAATIRTTMSDDATQFFDAGVLIANKIGHQQLIRKRLNVQLSSIQETMKAALLFLVATATAALTNSLSLERPPKTTFFDLVSCAKPRIHHVDSMV